MDGSEVILAEVVQLFHLPGDSRRAKRAAAELGHRGARQAERCHQGRRRFEEEEEEEKEGSGVQASPI